jgi:two-component system sensor histidine kinase PhoQ
VLTAFFGLVSVVLEQSFRESAEQALKEKLQVQAYLLLSAAEFKNSGELSMPANLPEPRFIMPGSGLYAFIQQPNKKLVWRSLSAVGLNAPPAPPELSPGSTEFSLTEQGRYALHIHVILKNTAGVERAYIFTVTEDAEFVSHQVQRFQESFRIWLLLLGVLLVFIQFMVMRWSLKPLRMIVKDLEAIEQGQKTRLDGQYATELEGLAGHLNVFINIERAHLERYRNALADLAHSLKTPLAIMRGCIDSCIGNEKTVEEQIMRMDEIVQYQLQKAAAKGVHKSARSVDISAIIKKTAASLNKQYIDRNITFDMTLPESCQVFYEEGDLYEISGNLIENACKWCSSTIKISILTNQLKGQKNYALLLQIEDDGPGFPPGKVTEILKRCVRADENVKGHGIGLAMVNDMITLLGGKLVGGRSELGGAKWKVYLP